MLVTVDDFSVSPGLAPIKLLTYLHSLMWEIPVGGCSVSTVRKSRLVAATRKVKTTLSVCSQTAINLTKATDWLSIIDKRNKCNGLLHRKFFFATYPTALKTPNDFMLD